MDDIIITFYNNDSDIVTKYVVPVPEGAAVCIEKLLLQCWNKMPLPAMRAVTYACYVWGDIPLINVYDRTPSKRYGWTWVNCWQPEDPAVIAELNRRRI